MLRPSTFRSFVGFDFAFFENECAVFDDGAVPYVDCAAADDDGFALGRGRVHGFLRECS